MAQLKRHLEARIPSMLLKVGACLLSALLAALLVPLQFMPRQALADGYTLGAKLVDGMPSPVPANTTFDVIVTVNNDTALSAGTLTLTYPAGMEVAGIVTSDKDVNGNQVMKAATSIDTQNRIMTFDLGALGAGSTTIPVRFCNSGIADPITLSGLTNGTCGYDVSTTAGSLGAIAFSFTGTAAPAPVPEPDITIAYVASKGGSTSPTSESLSPSTGTATGSTAIANPGYRFVNWTNDLDGTTTTDATLTSGQVDNVAKATGVYVATTFTANFEGETYTIRFDPNQGGGDDMDDETLTYGTSTLLSSNTYTRKGYTFTGWNTKADGTGTSYAAKADVAELDLATLDQTTSTVILYAQWKTSSQGGGSDSSSGSGSTPGSSTGSGTIDNGGTTTSGGLETESTSDGGYTTADYTYSGGTTTKAAAATPYVIVSKYTYGDDAEVKAGDTFILHLEITNTSNSLNVENMIMSLDCGAALALTNTANSYYIASLPAGQTTVVEFELKALASGKPEEATVGVDFKYEYVSDSTRTQGTTSEKITVPVEQPDRFSIGDATGTTDATPGTEATISIPYVNKGKSSVYNVEATLQTDMDTTSTYKYLGNFDAGASGTIDFFVTPEEAGAQKATIKITYEDSDNNEKSVDVPVTLDVQDATDEYGSAYGSSDLYGSMYGSESALTDGTDSSTPKIPWLWIGIGGGALIAIIIVSACIHHHRKRAEEKFLAGDDDDDDKTGKADAK